MEKLSVKERILETASDLFYNQGYNHTGINQIIAEANVAKASMYQHFRSKEDIAVQYLKNRHIMWMWNLNEFVKEKQTPYAILLASFDYLQTWLEEVNYVGCGFQNIATNLPKSDIKIFEQVLFHKNELREWIKNHLRSTNKYNDMEVDRLGNEILILMEGAIITCQVYKESWPVEASKRVAEKLIL